MASSTISIDEPEYFKAKKYTLLVLIGLGIVSFIAFYFFAPTITDGFLQIMNDDSQQSRDFIKSAIRLISVLGILWSVVNFYAVYKHHICLVTAMLIIQVIQTVLSLLGFLGGRATLGYFVGPLITSILLYFFLRDISLMRQQEKEAKHEKELQQNQYYRGGAGRV